ncbi:MAG TPA: hypothetical protein VL096_14875, partial [Pirellulaceae bacterium]|nr:hypothetical protein [Pirellulaceae bacterium]
MPVTRWRQSGELELYQFPSETRNFPGWHLHATLVGYQSLLTLAELLHESSQQARRSVALASVESGAIRNGGSGRLIAAHRWTIKFDPTLFPANHWYWEGTHDHPKLQLGSGKL